MKLLKSKILFIALVGAIALAGCSGAPPANTSSTDSSAPSDIASVDSESTGSGTTDNVKPSSDSAEADSEGVAEEEPVSQENLYRGVLKSIENGQFLLEQAAGRDYGFSAIAVNIPDTVADTTAFAIGDYIQINHNGRTTRSIPPQATAVQAVKLSQPADALVINGVVTSETNESGSHMLTINKLMDDESTGEEIILIFDDQAALIPADLDLSPGAKISAFSRGIMTMSLPPQCPVTEIAAFTYQPSAAQ